MLTRLILHLGLVMVFLGSALTVVYVQHERRVLYTELRSLERERDAMEIEWGQLRLEHSAWAGHDRIEGLALKRLELRPPALEAIVLVSP